MLTLKINASLIVHGVSVYQRAYFLTIEVFQELNIHCRKLQFAISNKIQCDFVKKVYSELIKEGIDGRVYLTPGGRAMRTILSTKFAENSYLIPIKNNRERCNRHEEWIDFQNNTHMFGDYPFLIPKIPEERRSSG